jgi:molybdopterin-containing oxidoreductase family molybdopterin binding subunit
MNYMGSLLEATSVDARLDKTYSIGMSRTLGATHIYPFMHRGEYKTLKYAKCIIFWGVNFADSRLHDWKFAADAKEKGATLIGVDVTLSTTSARCDKFVHLRPGSDTLLALSMLNEIVKHDDPQSKESWVDYDFMEKNTVAPFLVDTATKKFVRWQNLSATEKTLIKGTHTPENDAFIAYNGNNFVATKYDPELNNKPIFAERGKCVYLNVPNLGSKKVKTAYQMLKEHVVKYPAEKTGGQTGVMPEVVKELARIYCTNGPATLICGFGPDHYTNGHHTYHALTTVAAITGNFGKKGAEVGMFINFINNMGGVSKLPADFVPTDSWGGAQAADARLGSAKVIPQPLMPTIFNADNATEPTADGNGGPDELYKGRPLKIRALYVYVGNPITSFVDPAGLVKMLTAKEGDDYKMKLVVVADVEMTDTAQYADIVLPVAHWFEQDEIVASATHPYMLNQPRSLKPMGEAKSDMEIAELIVKGMGMGKYWLSYDQFAERASSRDYYKNFYKGFTGKDVPDEELPSYNRLKMEGAMRIMPGTPQEPYVYPVHRKKSAEGADDMCLSTQSAVNSSNSKRIEFYSDAIWVNFNYGQAAGTLFTPEELKKLGRNIEDEYLPGWEKPNESWPGNPTYSFQFINERPRWRVHSTWFNIPWMKEFDPYPIAKINKFDADRLGIKDDDMVKVYNQHGYCLIRAFVTGGLRKGVICIPRGWHATQFRKLYGPDAGASQFLTSSTAHPVTMVQSFFDVCVNIEKIKA